MRPRSAPNIVHAFAWIGSSASVATSGWMARSRSLRRANRLGINVGPASASADVRQGLTKVGDELIDDGVRKRERRLQAQHVAMPPRHRDEHALLVQDIFHLRDLVLAEDLARCRVLHELDTAE